MESRFRLFSIPGSEGLAFPTEKVDVTSGRLSKPIVWPGLAGVCCAAAQRPMPCLAWQCPSRVWLAVVVTCYAAPSLEAILGLAKA